MKQPAEKALQTPTSCVPPCQILLRLDRVLLSLGVLMGSEIGPATKARWYVMHKIVDAVHTCTDTVHVYIYIYIYIYIHIYIYICQSEVFS